MARTESRAEKGPQVAWAVLAVCCLAQFMVVLDISIVNIALPSMQDDLGLSAGGLQWVVNAYTLSFAGLLLFGGRAADLFGRRRVFVLGLAVFTLASLGGGFAQNEGQLILARAAQGIGGAVLAPATLSLLMTSFAEGRERTRALGAWGATAASGGAFGTVLGGVLTDVASWRWVLFVNVPIGIVLIVAARAVLVESRGQVRGLRDLDVPGTLTVTGGLVAIVYGIVRTESDSWTSATTIALLAGGVALLAAFLVIETRTENPLVPLRIFRFPGIAAANAIAAVLGAGMFAVLFFLTLYLQRVLGFSPLRAGLSILPMPVSIIVASQVVTRLIGRLGPRPLIVVGVLFSISGLFWMTQISAEGSYWTDVFGPITVMSYGVGTVMVAMVTAATSGVPMHMAGLASGLVNTGRQVGAAIGLAVVSTLAENRTMDEQRGGATLPHALTSGYSFGLFLAACVMVLGLPIALLLPRRGGPAVPTPAAGPSDGEPLAVAEAADSPEVAAAATQTTAT